MLWCLRGFLEGLRVIAWSCVRVRDKQQKIPHKHRKKVARTRQIQPEGHLLRNTKMEAMFLLESGQEL